MRNPKERIVAGILLLAVLFFIYSLAVSSASEPKTSASAAVLYEPITETFVIEKDANKRLPMASTTKIMTALVAIEHFPLDKSVRVADEAIGIEGSSLYLKNGEIFTMEELLYSLMLRSANDAAVAIAYAVAGGIVEFASLMNSKCNELGLKDTHFTNPHGLDDDSHYTTAKELAIIAAEAMKNDTFKNIVSTKSITVGDDPPRLISNHNKLLSLCDGANGIKTGFTKRSGRCLVGSCERDGLSFISVTINAPDDWNDHIAMFDYGYTLLTCLHGASAHEITYDIPIVGSTSGSIRVSNAEPFFFITKNDGSILEKHVKLQRYTSAPIKRGDILGCVIFTLNGEYVGAIDLTAETDVTLSKNKKSSKH